MSDFSRTLALAQQGLQERLHLGGQIYVSQDDDTLLDHAFGEARAGVPMTPDTLMVWMSSGKPLTAVAILQMLDYGKLDLDDPIATVIPEFAQGGKEAVTFRHALTHTGGFRGVASRMDALPWDQAIKMICEQRLEPNWVPGERAGYHIASSWYILGEAVQRLMATESDQQRTAGDVISDCLGTILETCGAVDSHVGMKAGEYFTYSQQGRIGTMHQLVGGELRPHASIDSADAVIPPRPASNARGPIRGLGKFYESLLHREDILSQYLRQSMIRPQRVGLFDQTFRLHVDWGLGVIVNSTHEDMHKFSYGFGPHASLQAFGHGGNQSSIGMADPKHGLVVAAVFNGMPGDEAHARRMRGLMAAIYEDLGLAI
jgi:CubicO group peptidase (beta-lactamase class C family)